LEIGFGGEADGEEAEPGDRLPSSAKRNVKRREGKRVRR
jgi:hypothetical protein